MDEAPLTFEKNGFPTVKIFDTHFDIKATDYWEFRTFEFSEVSEVVHYNPNEKWWNKLYILSSYWGQVFSENDSWTLKVIKKNGGDWEYKTSPKVDVDFRKIVSLLNLKVRDEK